MTVDRLAFTVLLEPHPERAGFTATVPAILEVVTEGDDKAHALATAREAIAFHLCCAVEQGLPLPIEPEPFQLAVLDVEIEALAAVE